MVQVNSAEQGTNIETVRYSPVNLVGQDRTQSVYMYDFKLTPVYRDVAYSMHALNDI